MRRAASRLPFARSRCANRLRKYELDHDAAVLQTSFRRVVVADRLACVASLDGDARGIDPVAAHEVVANRFGAAAIEIGVRTGGFTIVGVADDRGRRRRLLL